MKSLLVALAMVPCVAVAATPPLTGLYAVGELGLVEFSMADGKIVGKLRSSAQCVFAPDTQVVSGTFEGNVFIGTVTLCQDGASCPAQKTYPMMGVHHGDSVAAWIHLEAGCTSPALEEKKLVFRPATVEEKKTVVGDSSAAAIAQKQNRGDPTAQAAEAILEGNRLMQDQKISQAREKFRQAMESDDSRWEGFLGYGVTEVKLGRAARSLEHFDKALTIAQAHRATPAQLAQIHYNRACAQVAMADNKGAVTSLRAAIKIGGASLFADDLTTDPDLNGLRNDLDFKRLVADALVQSKKKPR